MRHLPFLIRTDALPEIGMGHLSRCLTLARALGKNGVKSVFAAREPSEVVASKVAEAGADLIVLPLDLELAEDLAGTIDLIGRLRARGVVLDGYGFDENYLNGIAENACCLFFDELALFHFNNALVLNQNYHAASMAYKCQPHTRLLLGPQYAVLRPEFTAARSLRREYADQVKKLLISFGGSDPHNLSGVALRGLAQSKNTYHIKVVLGGGSTQAEQTLALASQSPHKVEVLRNVRDMASVMNWADMALSASGTNTTLEMSCLGLPMVLVIQAENQRLIGEEMGRQGLAVQLGFWNEVSGSMMREAIDELAVDRIWRAAVSRDLMARVDGKGTDRVAAALLESCE